MYNNYLKVATIVPIVKLGKPLENAKEIVNIINNEQKASILLFPELAISGYSLGDYVFTNEFINENEKAIKYVIENIKDDKITIFGSALKIDSALYDCAIVATKNKILGVIPKVFLPRSYEFSDNRYFKSGKDIMNKCSKINVCGEDVDFGKLIFKTNNFSFGVEICADMFSLNAPHVDLFNEGVDIVFNPSASTYQVSKDKRRTSIVENISYKGKGAYVYVSNGPSETSSDVLYSGHSIISVLGKNLVNSEIIDFNQHINYADIDLESINYAKTKEGYFYEFNNSFNKVIINSIYKSDLALEFIPTKTPFVDVAKNEEQMIIDVTCAALYKRLSFIGINKVVLGISGGLDSTLALLFAVCTFKKYNIDLKNIIAVTLPSLATGSKSQKLAEQLMAKLNVSSKTIEIIEEVKNNLSIIGHDKVTKDITYENAQARYRTLCLMNLANLEGGLVLGTGDMSEIALGWSTFNGDQMSMYSLNSGIPKTVVKHLCDYFKQQFPEISDILDTIINAPITPELVGGNDNTEDRIGKYEINDFIMYHVFGDGASSDKCIYLLQLVFELSLEEATNYYNNFIRRFKRSQFKRLTSAEGVKIFSVSMSPRCDLRFPGDMY